MKKISARLAIVFSIIGLIIIIGCDLTLAGQPNDPDAVLLTGIGTLLACIPWGIATRMLHYRCWRAISSDVAHTSGGGGCVVVYSVF